MGRTQRCVHKKCSEKRLNTDCEQNEENCRKLSKNLLSSSGMTRSFDIPLKTGSSDWHPSLRTLRRQCLPCSKTSAHQYCHALTEKCLLAVVLQFTANRGANVCEVFIDRLERTVGLDQLRRSLGPDPLHARQVVGGVAREPLVGRHL